MIAFATVEITLEIVRLLIRNWYSKDRNDSPLAMYLKNKQHCSSGFILFLDRVFQPGIEKANIHSNKLFERFSIV